MGPRGHSPILPSPGHPARKRGVSPPRPTRLGWHTAKENTLSRPFSALDPLGNRPGVLRLLLPLPHRLSQPPPVSAPTPLRPLAAPSLRQPSHHPMSSGMETGCSRQKPVSSSWDPVLVPAYREGQAHAHNFPTHSLGLSEVSPVKVTPVFNSKENFSMCPNPP